MSASLPESLEAWPQSLRTIGDCCGHGVMLAVWRHYGGGHLAVPIRVPAAHHPLVQAIGAEYATKLCAAFAGSLLTIPAATGIRGAA